MTAGVCSERSLWDEVWHDYDRRAAVRSVPRQPVAPPPRRSPPPSPPPQRPPAARRLSRCLPRRLWGWRRSALALVALLCLYLGSPIASAMRFAAAVQQADPANLAARVDWTLLRPGIEARLTDIAATRLAGPQPAFLQELKSSLADQLASPEGLSRVLARHLPTVSGTGFGQALRQARPITPGLWQVSLASPDTPHQAVRLTLRLTDPLALQWAVVGVELPGRLGPWP